MEKFMSNADKNLVAALEPLADWIAEVEKKVNDNLSPIDAFLTRAKTSTSLAEITLETQSAVAELMLKGLANSLDDKTVTITSGSSAIFRKE